MPRTRSRASRTMNAIMIIGLIGSISSTAALALFILDRAGLLPFTLVPGYEGTYMQFAGYSADFPYSVSKKVGDPPPERASEWTLTPSYVNVDLDGRVDGVQNFIASGLSYNGRIETTPYGTVVSDGPVRYTKSWTEDGKTYTKTVEARVYYFTHKLYMTTKFDEMLFLGIGFTEKGCPVQNSRLLLYSSVVNWEPRGNDTEDTGAWILAAEVLEVKYWGTDNSASGARLREGLPDGSTASLGFAQGQTLPLSSNMDVYGGLGVLGQQYISMLQQERPDRISPDPRLKKHVYTALPIAELGAKGGNCFIASPLLVGNNPLVDVTIRLHVLKVDSWIAVQTRGATPQPPLPPGGTLENPLAIWWRDATYWLSTTFGVPVQIAGYVLIAILIFFAFLALMIVLFAVALRLGVSRRAASEVLRK